MQYIIGIDGGGTKTHCIIANQEGEALFECYGNASNFMVLGTDKVSETIFGLAEKCRDELNISFSDISAIILGTAGAGRSADAERMEKSFLEYSKTKNISFNLFHVESDARIALEGAFSGKPGSILISGTGSIIFGKDEDGNIHRAGGFGRQIGDEGSGFSIGKKGLAAVSKSYDGRGSYSLISELIKEKFSIDSSEKLINEVYKNNFDIASAAPVVLQAADQGDAAALKIIEDESEELILHISAMKKKLRLPVFHIVFIGGIITHDNILSRTLKKKIILRMPDVKVKEPDYSPAMGAVLIGKELLTKK